MPGSVTSVFGEPDEFQEALRQDGVANLLVVDSGQFRARLTQIALHRLHLSACDEQLRRVAFVSVPADMVFVTFPISDRRAAPLWAGVEMRAGEIITLGSEAEVHIRTEGSCSWAGIRWPCKDFVQYYRDLRGVDLVLPPAVRWRPPRAAFRQLRHFHLAAIRAVEGRRGPLIDRRAAHGLEQQVIHSLVECLSEGIAEKETQSAGRQRAILTRFEDLLRAKPVRHVFEIGAALDVSRRMMLACCNRHLGMGPGRYLRLRHMQAVYRALRSTDPGAASVSDVARQHGIRNLGHFAQAYHTIYGEFPSQTLRGPYREAKLRP